jgi:hypothetical protein
MARPSHPASYAMRTGRSTQGAKQIGRKAAHSLPSTEEVKNGCSYTFTPSYAFMAWCLITHRDHFYWCTHKKTQFYSYTHRGRQGGELEQHRTVSGVCLYCQPPKHTLALLFCTPSFRVIHRQNGAKGSNYVLFRLFICLFTRQYTDDPKDSQPKTFAPINGNVQI